MVDRRFFARINIKLQLSFLDPASGKRGQAETVDISANGVGFVTSEILSVKSPLEMWVNVPDNHDLLHIQGKVVWSRAYNGCNQQRVGVSLEKQEFLGLSRIMRFKEGT